MPEAPDTHQLPSKQTDKPPGPERAVVIVVIAALVVIVGLLFFVFSR